MMDESSDEKTPLILQTDSEIYNFDRYNWQSFRNVEPQKYRDDYRDDVINDDSDDDELRYPIEKMFYNIKKGNAHEVERLINDGMPVNVFCFEIGVTPCHFAAFYGKNDILQMFIKNGVYLNVQDRKGRTPLDHAVWNGYEKCVELILMFLKSLTDSKYDISENKTRTIMDAPIIDETINSLKEMDEVLCQCDTVSLASIRLHVKCLQLLIESNYSNINVTVNTYSPLDVCGTDIAVNENKEISDEKQRFEDVVRILINHKIPSKVMVHKSTPLHKAIIFNSREITNLLMHNEAYCNCFDEDGQTPFHLVITKKRHALIHLYLSQKESQKKYINFKNYDGLTPLHLAIKNEWKRGIVILLNSGADVLIKNNDGDTSLHLAAEINSSDPIILQEIIAALPDKRNQIDIRNNENETALTKAIIAGNEKHVKILLQEKASIKVSLKNNCTTLHLALKSKQETIIEQILLHNSELPLNEQIHYEMYRAENYFMTPLIYAAYDNNLEAIKLLLNYNISLKQKTKNHFTALHIAAIKGHIEIIKFILETDITLMHERDIYDWKPFYRAIQKNQRDCVLLFLKYGADLSETFIKDGREISVMKFIIKNMPRPLEFLENLFDSCIIKNDYEIDDEKCEIVIDFSILMPNHENTTSNHQNQTNVVVSLLNAGGRMNQKKLLMHPFIETFLYMKWKTGLKYVYLSVLCMFSIFLISLTLSILNIYSEDSKIKLCHLILMISTAYLILQEILIISILSLKNKMRSYLKRITGLMNLLLAALSIVILSVDFKIEDRIWPKVVAAFTILLAWIELVILISNIPGYGYTYQMFSTVTVRAAKVIAVFGIEVLIGYAVAFWVLFQGQPHFDKFADSLVKTVIMTSELDYSTLFDSLETEKFRHLGQLFLLMFIFFVPIVMMNLIMALVISDTNDLKIEGKIKRLTSHVLITDILDTMTYFLLKKRLGNVERVLKMYPGKPSWTSIGLVTNNIEEVLFKRVLSERSEL